MTEAWKSHTVLHLGAAEATVCGEDKAGSLAGTRGLFAPTQSLPAPQNLLICRTFITQGQSKSHLGDSLVQLPQSFGSCVNEARQVWVCAASRLVTYLCSRVPNGLLVLFFNLYICFLNMNLCTLKNVPRRSTSQRLPNLHIPVFPKQ